MSSEADVLVVGAGLAGLSAATRLRGAGLEVKVLEARERVGGRLLRRSLGDGHWVDVGGQWMGPTQTRLAALAHELGAESFPTYAHGENAIEWKGKVKRYRGEIPRINPAVLLDTLRAQRRIARGMRPIAALLGKGDVVPRPGRASSTARRSGRGCRPTRGRAGRARCWRSRSRRCGRPSRRTCRCCTCSSTRPQRAASNS